MADAFSSRRLHQLVATGAVLFAFWPALFAGGSLVSADIVQSAQPFDSYQPDGFTLETGPGDPINIHAHWGALASDVRSGDVGWWNRDLAIGQPTMKGGLPIFDVAYVAVPAWFAPGLVAAIRALTAIGLMAGFLRALDLNRIGALAGGLAFGFSGFMVGWMNWPHSSVAALAPGLLWAIERLIRDPRMWRAVPLAAAVSAMAWSNFPLVTVYVLLGAGVYTAIRLLSERGSVGKRRPTLLPFAAVGVVAVVLALLMASPHLLGFAEYLDWADTSHRGNGPADSSAGLAYMMTAVAPAIWGSDAVGAPWFGEGNWVEFNAHAGASVVVLGLFGLVAGMRHHDRRRRSAAVGVAVMGGLGILIAYVGGPAATAIAELSGSSSGLMTRAKVLWSLAIAVGAGFGVDRLASEWSESERPWIRREAGYVVALIIVALVALVPSISNWYDAVRAIGAVRQTMATLTVPFISAVAVVAIGMARWRRWVTPAAAGWALVAIMTFELLSFAMPVPTIAERDQRLSATPAHDQVASLLGPGQRLGGERQTFFPSTGALFDIDDFRGQSLKSPGYQALLRAVDPAILNVAVGATPTYPNVVADTTVVSAVWDSMAIGVWAQIPQTIPPGTQTSPPNGTAGADPAIQPLRSSIAVPEGGLRAVLIEVVPVSPGFVETSITAGGRETTETRWIDPVEAGVVSFAFAGDDLPAGADVEVEVTSSSPPGTILVSVDDRGSVVTGFVAGDDDLDLVRAGDVTLIVRPDAAFVSISDAVVVEPDLVEAAQLVALRPPDERQSVVSTDVGLPAETDATADLELLEVSIGTDRVGAIVETDRPAIVVFAQSDYPGWSATVDGEAAEIVTADAAFAGVVVPAGRHIVALEFRPTHLTSSPLLAASGLLGCIWLLLRARKQGDLHSSIGHRQ